MKLNIKLPKRLDIDLPKLSLIVSSACLLLSAYALCAAQNSNKIYTVGVNRLTESFTQQLGASNLSPKQRADYMLDFAESLEKNISSLSKKGVIVLMEESVISGGQDITDDIAAKMKNELKK